jgi:hypothetical protein
MVFEKKCNHLSLGDDKALKSRARIKRRCRDEEVLLHLFINHHKSRARLTWSLRRPEKLLGPDKLFPPPNTAASFNHYPT